MAYSPTEIEKQVRVYLGGVEETLLPEAIIFTFADLHDANPAYTSKEPYILWKTVLSSLDYLRASTTTSSTGNSAKFTRKEKVGEVEITETQDNSSGSTSMTSFDALYKDYAASPEKFGIYPSATSAGSTSTGAVVVTGTNAPNLALYRSVSTRARATSIYTER